MPTCRLRLDALESRVTPAVFLVTNTNATGAGSLDQAIDDANGDADPDADTIRFAIGAVGSRQTIPVGSGGLSPILDAVTLDGFSQGGAGYAGPPLIELDGSAAGPVADGLITIAVGGVFRGLVINRFGGNGVNVFGASDTVVESCYIGTDATGTAALGNGGDGVRVQGLGTQNVTVRGNLIAGNGSDGVDVRDGVMSAAVTGNRIGVNAAGTAPLGNAGDGVFVAAAGVTVTGNLIGGNGNNGVYLSGPAATGAVVAGNRVGVGANGEDLGNAFEGVLVAGGATGNLIGGTAPGAGNTVFNNRRSGVVVGLTPGDAATTGNRVLGNAIDGNARLGIDLGNDGVTPNGPVPRAFPNNGQTFPELTAGPSAVTGTLTARANTTYRVELFAGPAADPSGFGEGRAFLGAVTVTTDAGGQAAFTFPTAGLAAGTAVTATATNGDGTSEFSQAVFVPAPPPPPPAPVRLSAVGAGPGGGPVVVVYNADGSERFRFFAFVPTFTGGVRVATGDLTGDGVDDVIVGAGPGGGPVVSVFNGVDASLVASFLAYVPSFTGGVFVAADDGVLVTGAGAGGGPQVNVYTFAGGVMTASASFFAYAPLFQGGVSVAVGGGVLATGAGPGGAPHVVLYDLATLAPTASFFAFPTTFAGGVSVALGGGFLVVGPGPTIPQASAPQLLIFDLDPLTLVGTPLAFAVPFAGGVNVGVADTTTGPVVKAGAASQSGLVASFLPDGTPLGGETPFGPLFLGGVFVG